MLTTQDFADMQMTNAAVAAAGVAGIYSGCMMHLYIQPVQITKSIDDTLLIEPTAPGYAPQVVTWTPALRDSRGLMAIISNLVKFNGPGDGSPGYTVVGYFLKSAPGNRLLAVEPLITPVPLIDAQSFLGIVSQITFGAPPAGTASIVT